MFFSNEKRIEDITSLHTKIIQLEQENHILKEENNQLHQENNANNEEKINVVDINENIAETISIQQQLISNITDNYESVSHLNIGINSIEQVIELINDLSEQTNQLAVNAASIAIRAGEHGRGMTVIAEIVGKLAERTQHATYDIGESIQGLKQNATKIYERCNSMESISLMSSKKLENCRFIFDNLKKQTKQGEEKMNLSEEPRVKLMNEEVKEILAEIDAKISSGDEDQIAKNNELFLKFLDQFIAEIEKK